MSKISGVVVAYNRASVLEACLSAARFVDELIVIDKSSSDATPDVARKYADRHIVVPWTPVVEHTRAFGIEQSSHDLVLSLDDDEILSPACAEYFRSESRNAHDVYAVPFRDFILGRHDERGYYWPGYRYSFFRKGVMAYSNMVHVGMRVLSEDVHVIPQDSPVCIHHLSHADVHTWMEKTNRYTSQVDRAAWTNSDRIDSLATMARERLEHWLGQVREPDNYLEAVAILRAIYDMVDSVKMWEAAQPDGNEAFRTFCEDVLARKHLTPT